MQYYRIIIAVAEGEVIALKRKIVVSPLLYIYINQHKPQEKTGGEK
jgi:hypothetical protein